MSIFVFIMAAIGILCVIVGTSLGGGWLLNVSMNGFGDEWNRDTFGFAWIISSFCLLATTIYIVYSSGVI